MRRYRIKRYYRKAHGIMGLFGKMVEIKPNVELKEATKKEEV